MQLSPRCWREIQYNLHREVPADVSFFLYQLIDTKK